MTAKKIQNSVDWPIDTYYKEPQMSADSSSSSNSYTAAAERSVFHGTLYSLHAQCSSAICTWSSHNCWVYILLADFSISNERASDTEESISSYKGRDYVTREYGCIYSLLELFTTAVSVLHPFHSRSIFSHFQPKVKRNSTKLALRFNQLNCESKTGCYMLIKRHVDTKDLNILQVLPQN